MTLDIRPARLEDLAKITEIYNQAILRTTATFDTEAKTVEQQRGWWDKHGERNPVLVASRADEVVGWASISPWSDRCAYAATGEIAIYIAESARGQGVGKALMSRLMSEARRLEFHTLLAKITQGNASSIHLHEMSGFKQVGNMNEVGRKFDRWLDVGLYQCMLS